MSKFCDRLIAHIETNPSFIEPEMHRNSILTRLKKEGLKDLCISRTAFTWGIPMPTGFNANHVMYVWFDALSNYLSGICALDSKSDLASFWPASLHIIGKDIIWFHTVIWYICFLIIYIELLQLLMTFSTFFVVGLVCCSALKSHFQVFHISHTINFTVQSY